MKVLINITAALLLLAGGVCHAQNSAGYQLDSVKISLLTCSSFEKIYALYGHTAIRIQDTRTGSDVAVNYGLFSFEKPFFALRFVFGLTDYEMGLETYEDLYRKYKHYRCSIIQQELNLTDDEKEAILTAMTVNYMPENRVYRYNYFYDNCTTRARDMIVNHINGTVVYGDEDFSGPPFRDIVHSCNAHRPWARFGNDLLLGIGADMSTTRDEYQFLPANLMNDFNDAVIITPDGQQRPLVKETSFALRPGIQTKVNEFPLRPRICAIILLVVTIVLTIAECLTRRKYYIYDALLMLVCGLAGIILFAMLFSHHPTVRLNLQLLLLNPLPLFFIWRMIKTTRRHRVDWQYAMWTLLIVLFFSGTFVQNYAEGMIFLALSLLIRNLSRMADNMCLKKKR